MLEYGLWAGGRLHDRPRRAARRRRPGRGLASPRRAGHARALVRSAACSGSRSSASASTPPARRRSSRRRSRPCVVERNLIYLAPVALRRDGDGARATAASGSPPSPSRPRSSLYLLVATPYNMDTHFYYDAPGLAILAAANRAYGWTPEHAETVLLWMLARGGSRSSRRSSSLRRRLSLSIAVAAARAHARLERHRRGQRRARLDGVRGPADGATCRSRRPGSTARRAASRRSTSARRSPTRTGSGCSSSGIGRSSGSGASTAPRPVPGRR